LTPGRIEGFLWLATALCWVNGVLLFAILCELLPQARILPAAATVLLIVDRSEPTRFFVMFTTNNYWMALAFLLMGVWLFLRSYRIGSRPLLALSCAALGGTSMISEAGYPLAALAPILAWFRREHRQRLPTWTYAWVGTLALFALRFLLFLADRGAQSYQGTQLTGVLGNPGLLLNNLKLHLKAGLVNFQMTGGAVHFWKEGLAVLALGCSVVGLTAWRPAAVPRRRSYVMILGLSALALLLGTLPYLPIAFVFRTQFFAAPGQAVLVAGGLCLVAGFLGRRMGEPVVAATVGLLVANATGETFAGQQRDRRASQVNFERTVHIFRQIHAVCPNPSPDTLILLVPAHRGFAPLGCNYPCLDMAPRLLGARMMQVGVRDGLLAPPAFQADSVTVGKASFHIEATYDKLVAFRVGFDGTLTLLHRLPDRLLPSNNSAALYDPLARLRPGAVRELAYLRYPRWAERPRDLFDMADGVVFGQGWGPLECHEGTVSRRAAQGAELVVNSFGQGQRELRLQVDTGGTGQLEAIDLEGKVLATAVLGGCREVRLPVPTDPVRATLIRLRVTDGSGGFRALYPGGKVTPFLRPRPPPPDIVADDTSLDLGDNWHGLETHQGESWRWVANDAEVVVGFLPAARASLLLDVEPGPGLNGQPCLLSLRNHTGEVLATARIARRQETHLALPAGLKAGTVLRLHTEGGGLPTQNDPRILNFRIFRCDLTLD
jgi:hypothetical protein